MRFSTLFNRLLKGSVTPKEEWNPFDDYIEGKCEVTVGLQEIEERLEKELNALQPGE